MTELQKWSLKVERNRLIKATDWTQLNDSPLTEAKKLEFATYRQALRDLPQSFTGDVNAVVWPDAPSV